MTDSENKLKLVDKLIFLFTLIFLVSLPVSIFVNQIGYFGALLLLIFRYFLSKDNPFSKTGLELAFIWFLLAEIISGFLSVDQAHSFRNLLKRLLLIPVVYVTAASVTDLRRAKLYFKIFIAASLLSAAVYLFFAYRYYLMGKYNADWAGPDLFQYPITTSEIMSFTVVFFFAFFINEKGSLKLRILYLAGFLLSAAGLLSTLKRTGWMGAAFGLLIIMIVKKQWVLLVSSVLVFAAFIVFDQNESEVRIYEYEKGELSAGTSFRTEGRASGAYPIGNAIAVCDYENGLLVYRDSAITEKLMLPGPVQALKHWKNNYYIASLADTRFVLLRRLNERFEIVNEFISPGYTAAFSVMNNYFYAADRDSGLTVFFNPEDLNDTSRFGGNYINFWSDSAYFIFLSAKNRLSIYETVNFLPGRMVIDTVFNRRVLNIFLLDNRFLLSTPDRLELLQIEDKKLKLLDKDYEVPGIIQWTAEGKNLFGLNLNKKIYEFENFRDNTIRIKHSGEIQFLPVNFLYSSGRFYFTYINRSKIKSIWDVHHQTNSVRLSLWRAGWEIFKDNCFFGVGDINMGEYQKQYKRYYEKEIHGHLHNNYIHVLAALGLFGFLAVGFLLIKMLLTDIRIYKAVRNIPFVSSYSLGALGAFCAFLAAGMTELNIWDHEIITLVYFIFGLNFAFYFYTKSGKEIS